MYEYKLVDFFVAPTLRPPPPLTGQQKKERQAFPFRRLCSFFSDLVV